MIELDNRKEKDIGYNEVLCSSFEDAVEKVVSLDGIDSRFCLVDIDGTLIINPLIKVPFVSHLLDTRIDSGIEDSFLKLVGFFDDGNFSLVTNRNSKERFFWNSHQVLGSVKGLLGKCGKEDSLFTGLNKQVPRLFEYRYDGLMEKFCRYIDGKDCLTLYCIEDFSLVSLNRSDFLVYLGKRIEKEFGVLVNIENYVIRL